MTIEGREQEIIAEQRDQLMQLREVNKQLRATARSAGHTLDDIRLLSAGFKDNPEGKTVGLRIPDDTRERLLALKPELGAKTYRQVLQTCIELGLRAVEEARDANTSAVEAVPAVQRPADKGDSPVRAAASY